ncbi:hypothetical protein LPJ53_004131 [Coemansia erecta]|uniref:Uncharacterized protein n=1 Tax=Coemansia erecta TaxID=147472 RepID=A0A9W8CPH9_9FUNG|nr:hypothetical protein LPJ53_004131 [Coemansia erecta]
MLQLMLQEYMLYARKSHWSADQSPLIHNLSPESELSPELSKDTHDISRLDGDIDMQFFDVMAAHRKYIRSFVEEYIQKHFGSFYYRVAIRDRQASRLCQSLNAYFHAHQSISNATLLAAIEKKMATLDATYFDLFINASDTTQLLDLNSSDRHFHMSLLAAVQECKIYEDDANWPSADAYATAFFNRIIEDVQFILFEGHQGTFVEDGTTSAGSQTRFSRVKDIAARVTPFKRACYLGTLASMLTAKYIGQMGRKVFLERAQLAGYRPVPTDIDFDNNLSEEDLEVELGRPSSDVAIRGELHSMIMEMMPYTTNESTMIAMQRAIEVYNRAIVDHVESQRGEIGRAFTNADAKIATTPHPPDGRVLDAISHSKGTMAVDTVCVLARWLSELWFDRLKGDLLGALLVDRQLRPVPLNDVRRWIFEDHSPSGHCIAFAINTRLYSYLKHMRVLMNETKWLFASAAATLRAIELLLANLRSNSVLLEHVSVEKYAQLFGEYITSNTTSAGGPERSSTNAAHVANRQAISQTPDLENPHKRLEALTRAPAENAAGIQHEQPYIQTRIDALELEVADIRKTMREMAGMHHDLHEVLQILKSNNFR